HQHVVETRAIHQREADFRKLLQVYFAVLPLAARHIPGLIGEWKSAERNETRAGNARIFGVAYKNLPYVRQIARGTNGERGTLVIATRNNQNVHQITRVLVNYVLLPALRVDSRTSPKTARSQERVHVVIETLALVNRPERDFGIDVSDIFQKLA